jgi:hypothetical protein
MRQRCETPDGQGVEGQGLTMRHSRHGASGGWLVGRHFLDYRQGLFGIRIATDAADGRNDLAV